MAITGVNGTAGDAYWDTAIPASTYLVVNGGSITVAADLYSQYAVARPGVAVTARVTAGRNLQTTATALVTDASGEVKFTLTDAAPTSATTFDTITFSDGTVSGTVTINYVAALTATTMTTSPSATTTTALSPADLGAINTATATASTGRDSVTATVLDAAGVAIVGMPVTLTVPAGVEFHSTTPAVAYTSATGVATSSVYGWTTGTYTVTATYSSNGSCHAVSLNRLLGNPLSEIVPTQVKSSNMLDYLQNVGTDDITSTWGCYDMSDSAVVEEVLLRPQLGDL
jgi:hypothetical protein